MYLDKSKIKLACNLAGFMSKKNKEKLYHKPSPDDRFVYLRKNDHKDFETELFTLDKFFEYFGDIVSKRGQYLPCLRYDIPDWATYNVDLEDLETRIKLYYELNS